jgi:hypothetical protein
VLMPSFVRRVSIDATASSRSVEQDESINELVGDRA